MSDPVHPPTPPPQHRPATMAQVPFEQTRWRVRVRGKDFGPWSPEQIKSRIRAHELTGDTQVFEQWNDRECRLGDISQFAQLLESVRRDDVDRQHSDDTRATEEIVISDSRKRRWWTALMATLGLAVLLVGGDHLIQAVRFPPANIVHGLYADLGLSDLALAREQVRPNPVSDSPTPSPRKVRRKKRVREEVPTGSPSRTRNNLVPTGNRGVLVSGGAAPTLSFDETDDKGVKVSLNRGKLDDELTRVKTRLKRCLEEEGLARPGFRGATVTFWIQPDGRPNPVRLGGTPKVSRELVRCIKRATGGFQVPAFDDVAQRVDLRIDVMF